MFGEKRLQSLAIPFEILRAAKRNENDEDTSGRGSDHGALGIARCASVRTEFVGEKWQAFEIEVVFANALVRFARETGAERDITLNVGQVVQTDRQAALDADDINDVHDSVNARQSFACNDSAKQSFRGTAITCGIFSKRFVACAGRKNGWGFKYGARIRERSDLLLASSKNFFQSRQSHLGLHVSGYRG